MPFQKGQSGNPRGRRSAPVDKTIMGMAKAHTDKALRALLDVLESRSASHQAKVAAANSILDRGWGKAPQDVRVKGELESKIISLVQGLDTQRPADNQAEDRPTTH